MAQMKKIRSDMEFMIVTDDVTMAHKLLPGIPAYHFPVHGDYCDSQKRALPDYFQLFLCLLPGVYVGDGTEGDCAEIWRATMFRMATGLRSRIFIPDLSILAGTEGFTMHRRAGRSWKPTAGRANFLQNIMKSRTEWRIVWEKSRQRHPIRHILAGARSEA